MPILKLPTLRGLPGPARALLTILERDDEMILMPIDEEEKKQTPHPHITLHYVA